MKIRLDPRPRIGRDRQRCKLRIFFVLEQQPLLSFADRFAELIGRVRARRRHHQRLGIGVGDALLQPHVAARYGAYLEGLAACTILGAAIVAFRSSRADTLAVEAAHRSYRLD